ncbi:MAG: DUF1566 domain-containing protein [Acidobacteriaceae bacterium]|jgi:hypothetical protein
MRRGKHVLIFLSLITLMASGQALPNDDGQAQKAKTREYWFDASTDLMWADHDNGQDVSWKKAVSYCRDLRLAGYSDWTLPTIYQLLSINDSHAEVSGATEVISSGWKGGLTLTGSPWSSERINDDRGKPSGYAFYVDWFHGQQMKDQLGYSAHKRALCVRKSKASIASQNTPGITNK